METTYSIIIPHFNIHKLLRRLLLSIPRRDDLQIIVVDDCSTKNLDEYEQVKNEFPYVEFYSTGTNGGGGKARNIGLKRAKGKYLIFADSDDFFSDCFDTLLCKYKESDYDVVFFNIDCENNSKEPSSRIKAYRNNFELFQESKVIGLEKIKYSLFCPWGKIISNDFLRENLILCQETRIHNDAMFAAKVSMYAKNIAVEHSVGYILTEQEKSISKIITPENLVTRYKVFHCINKMLRDNDIHLFYFIEYKTIIELILRKEWKCVISCLKAYAPNLDGFFYLFKRK